MAAPAKPFATVSWRCASMHRLATFNDLSTETLQQILQLLTNSDPHYLQEDAVPHLPSPKPRRGFLTSVASLSLVCKSLRDVCKPFLFSYACCKSLKRLTTLTHFYRNNLSPNGFDAGRKFVKWVNPTRLSFCTAQTDPYTQDAVRKIASIQTQE